MAIAPPLTFTLAVSQASSLLTAQAWAAKASLASTRSRSSFFQPALASAARLAVARAPPAPRRGGRGRGGRRLGRGAPQEDDARERRPAALLGLLGRHQH